jgi:hypothetical protein
VQDDSGGSQAPAAVRVVGEWDRHDVAKLTAETVKTVKRRLHIKRIWRSRGDYGRHLNECAKHK